MFLEEHGRVHDNSCFPGGPFFPIVFGMQGESCPQLFLKSNFEIGEHNSSILILKEIENL